MAYLTIRRIITAVVRRIRHQFVLFSSKRNSRKAVEQAVGENILVLCYGNIYRSPLVEFLLKKNDILGDFSIRSAGFFEKSGRACDNNYLSLLRDRGYDLSNHRSSVVSKDDLSWADIVIIMDRKNWDKVCDADIRALRKVVWVGAFNKSGPVEVDDPYGKGVAVTQDIISQIEKSVDNLFVVLNG